MLKLGKYALFSTGILLLVIVGSRIQWEIERADEEGSMKGCNDTVANFDSDSLTFWFRRMHNFKQIEITHRRKGYEAVIPYYYTNRLAYHRDDYRDDVLVIKNPDVLYRNDTIRIVINGKTIYDLSGFENKDVFHGRRFVGCFLRRYTLNGSSESFAGNGLLFLEYEM